MIPLSRIEIALKSGQPFEIEKFQLKFLKVGCIDSIQQLFADPSDFEKAECKRFFKNARWFSDVLKNTPRVDWDGFDKFHQLVVVVKLFLKSSIHYEETSEFKNCSLELLGFRLGVEAAVLKEEKNAGFIEFAKKSHLHNSLMTFNHYLVVNEQTQEISIKYQGEYILWSEAKPIVENFLGQFKAIKDDEPYAMSLYGRLGIQNKNRYCWTKLEPFLKGDTDLFARHFIKDPYIFDVNNKSYVMEFCSSATEKAPRILFGDHSWVRLYAFTKTDQKIIGKMYSIGLYRPNKQNFIFDNFWMPFCIKKGYITCDISEEWGINHQIKTIAKSISYRSYKNIKAKIIEDNKSDNQIFHLFHYNCDRYVHSLAKLGGVKLPTRRHFLELFTCIHLKNDWDKKLVSYSPVMRGTALLTEKFVKGMIFMLTPFFNLLFYLVGSGLISKNVKFDPKIKPILSKLADFFNSKKLYLYSPWVLGHGIKEEVERWRKSEIQKLSFENQHEKNKIAFAFPPHLLRGE